ncbi:MAG: hypothetical protein ACLPXZ_09725, partial [Mycobacterium sp.]
MAVPSVAWGAARGVVPESAEWGAVDGAVQLGGVDSPPIELAPPKAAVTPMGEAMSPPVCAAAASAEPASPAAASAAAGAAEAAEPAICPRVPVVAMT